MNDRRPFLLRGADLLVSTLVDCGVTRIFSLSGNQIMPLYDACLGSGIEIVHVRHEAAAVFMAEGWAQLTGEVGVALVTAGPGAANAVGPLMSARQSETPLLLLSGDSPRAQDGMGAFQTLDQVAATAPFTKHSARVGSVPTLAHELRAALTLAQAGRPGPVHLALPQDLLTQRAEGAPSSSRTAAATAPASEREAGKLAAEIAAARRPLIVTSGLFSPTRGGDLARRLGQRLAVPVVALESPRGLRDPAQPGLRQRMAEADLVISLGKSVDYMLDFGRATSADCGWIVVEPEDGAGEEALRNLGPKLRRLIAADPRALAHRLADLPEAGCDAARRDWCARFGRRPAPPALDETPGPIDSGLLCATLSDVLGAEGGETILVSDGGEFGQWAQALVRAERRLINGPAGGIGGALGHAVAASLACPGARIAVASGDGSIGFHLAELETAVRAGAAFVVVIGNDRRWNAEHLLQLREFGPDRVHGCELSGARYDLVAAALGGTGAHVTCRSELRGALRRAFAAGGVVLVNVEIEGRAAPSGEEPEAAETAQPDG
ncbi:thiamine pyrophosphate-binding protein [Cereibacter johrii]|uniref:thiamine pyrophosphate-binding protein n=1 Tax=Cereibacter johrii TaxID=445629 RepID=UPI003CEA75C1